MGSRVVVVWAQSRLVQAYELVREVYNANLNRGATGRIRHVAEQWVGSHRAYRRIGAAVPDLPGSCSLQLSDGSVRRVAVSCHMCGGGTAEVTLVVATCRRSCLLCGVAMMCSWIRRAWSAITDGLHWQWLGPFPEDQ